jgi:hypothetical protein
MKLVAIAPLALFFAISPLSWATAAPLPSTAKQLAIATAEAYSARNLSQLDTGRPTQPVRLTLEHSLGEDSDRLMTKAFRNLTALEQWLRSQENSDGLPTRESRPLLGCRKQICTYNFQQGILHNHLYLKKITYGFHRGRPYIKEVHLLNGD